MRVCQALFLLLAFGALVSCATERAARAGGGSIDATIHERIAEAGGLVWDAARPLAWSDFQAVAPAGGEEGAQTGYSLLFGLGCTGSVFRFEAAAVFLPAGSWVKPVVLASPQLLSSTLEHEQTHFDLTEVYARRLRRYLGGAYSPCGARMDETRDAADRLVTAEADAQHRYDEETRHGLVAARQQAWDRDVAGWLDELAAYRAPDGAR